MANKKTTIIKMEGYVTYPKVTPETMDEHEMHEATQGQFNCNFFFKSEADLEMYLDAGAPEVSMGNQMIKEDADAEMGIGKFVKLKRPNVHKTVKAFGGAPRIFDWRDEKGTAKLAEPIGNWSECIAKVSVYGSGPTAVVRLEALAITNLVEYDPEESGVGYDPDVF